MRAVLGAGPGCVERALTLRATCRVRPPHPHDLQPVLHRRGARGVRGGGQGKHSISRASIWSNVCLIVCMRVPIYVARYLSQLRGQTPKPDKPSPQSPSYAFIASHQGMELDVEEVLGDADWYRSTQCEVIDGDSTINSSHEFLGTMGDVMDEGVNGGIT